MCIRDSSNGVRVNLKPTEFDKDSINITFAVDGGELSLSIIHIFPPEPDLPRQKCPACCVMTQRG